MKQLLEAWAGVRAVDHHCHPLWRWPRTITVTDLRAMFTEALDPRIIADHVTSTVGYRDALRRIAAMLACDPTEEAILRVRANEDPTTYANQVMQRSATGVLLLDHGFASGDTMTLAEHAESIHLSQYEIVRLETLAETLVATSDTAQAWFAATRARIRDAKQNGAIGIKTIAAYRAGLRLARVDSLAVEAEYRIVRRRAQQGEPVRLEGAPLVHALLFEVAEECMRLSLPLQVHCGLGDPDEDLAACSPLGLRPLLTDPTYDGLQVVLLHCYPFHREAAYLCAVFPGVFMDLSLTIPLGGLEGARAMRETLGLCPWTKLLYASDASRLPEYFFVAAAAHREALAGALGELIERQILTYDDAVAAGTQVLAENARRLYRLGSDGRH